MLNKGALFVFSLCLLLVFTLSVEATTSSPPSTSTELNGVSWHSYSPSMCLRKDAVYKFVATNSDQSLEKMDYKIINLAGETIAQGFVPPGQEVIQFIQVPKNEVHSIVLDCGYSGVSHFGPPCKGSASLTLYQ